jgi:hypothetical protein
VGASLAESTVYRAQADVDIDRTTIFYAFVGLDDQLAYGSRDPALAARDSRVLEAALDEAGVRESLGSLLAMSSVRHAGGDPRTIEVAVENGDPALAARLATAYARAFARQSWTLDVASAKKVLPSSKARVRAVHRLEGASSETVDFVERQLALLSAMSSTPTATASTAKEAAQVWPRPALSALLAGAVSLVFAIGVALLAPRMRIVPARFLATGTASAALAGAVVLGLGSAAIEGSASRAVGLITIACVPFLAALATIALPLLAAAVVFMQAFEGYELRTPVATLSPGVAALLIFLVWARGDLLALFRYRVAQILGAAVVVLVAAHALQFLEVSARITLRGLVTTAGVALFWLAGLYLARQTWGMTAAGIGAVLGLSVLGLAAVLVAAHVLPQSYVISGGRTFFGFESPFPRTYGLSVAGLFPSLFLPLAIPWLTLLALATGDHKRRLAALVTVGALFLLVVFFFQSRSMLLQIAVGVTVAALAFCGAAWQRLLGLGGLVVAAAFAVPSLLFATDRLSTHDRLTQYRLAWEFFREDPRAILVGTDPAALAEHINARLVPPQPASAPIHNVLIQSLAEGGILAAAAALAILVVPVAVWSIVVIRRRTLSISPAAAWIPAVGAMLAVEMFSYAFVANAGNAWLGFGMMAGYSAGLWAWSCGVERQDAAGRRGELLQTPI